ncbi:MAG: histidine--tRNA ligase [Candidatus Margulisbacteria bacterium]|nr:histidine--tRNA ligase [Candidatus Margulisiibacteriota bacterium]
MKYTAPRGTKDILPEEAGLWQYIEDNCRDMFFLNNYQEIRTPVFEATELFSRSIGQTTDIVKKEMYTFADRKGRSLTLRPEATAAVVRAGLENNLISPDNLTKLFYIGPMFRYERPQAGRQRQFHQAGVEAFGSADPLLDAEVIIMAVRLFNSLGLADLQINLNSVGCGKCQPGYRQSVQDYFRSIIGGMCADCQERLETNPMRILDCKEAACQKIIASAPVSTHHLCEECDTHYKKLLAHLDLAKVKYQQNDRLVRGLDYYTKTAFEVVSSQLGAQNAVCGGGRYDKLVEELGGKPTPAIGFAIGLERLVEVMKQAKLAGHDSRGLLLYIATIGETARKVAFDLLLKAREMGIPADMDYAGKSLKSQMKAADRLKAQYVYIIGEDEVAKGSAVLKTMASSEERTVTFENILYEPFGLESAHEEPSCGGCGGNCGCDD